MSNGAFRCAAGVPAAQFRDHVPAPTLTPY